MDKKHLVNKKPRGLKIAAIFGALALMVVLGMILMSIFGNPMEISKARKNSINYVNNTLKLEGEWIPSKTIKDKVGYSTIFTKKGSQDYFIGILSTPDGNISEFGYGGYLENALIRLARLHSKTVKDALQSYNSNIKGFDLNIRIINDSKASTNIIPDMEYKKDMDVNYEIELQGNLETKDTALIVEKLKGVRNELKKLGFIFKTWNFNSNYNDGVLLSNLDDSLFDDSRLIDILEKNKNKFDAKPKFITDWRNN